MNRLKQSLYLLALILIQVACNFNPDNLVPPQWDTSFIGPLVRTSASLDKILDIEDQHFSDEFVLCDLPSLPTCTGPIIVPPVSPPIDLPSDTLNYTDIYNQITLDSGIINLTISNDLPMNIKAGLTVEINNSDGSNLVSFVLGTDLQPNQSAFFTDNLSGRSLSSAFIVEFKDFASDGSGGVVNLTGTEKIGFEFEVITLKVREVSLVPGNVFSLADTSEFTLDDGIVINSQPLTGSLNLICDNQFAAGFAFQAYFLNEAKNLVLDSLLPNGVVYPDSVSTLTTEITEERLLNLKSAAWVVSKMDWIAVPNDPSFNQVILFNTDSLNVTMVAELKVRIKP